MIMYCMLRKFPVYVGGHNSYMYDKLANCSPRYLAVEAMFTENK